MATMTVERENLTDLVKQWAERSGNGAPTVEVLVLPGQLVIRELGSRAEEVDAWIDGYFQRRDGLMKRLADA